MKYLAGYVLLVLGGNSSPSESDLTKFLKGINVDVNEEQVKAVVAALSGKQLHELANLGIGKISSLNVGGGAAANNNGAAENKVEAEEEEEEEEEEEDMDFGDMFG